MDPQWKPILERMRKLCSTAEKSSGEIREKLRNYKLKPEETGEIINLLKNEKYIDDKRFAHAFVRDKFRFNHWGRLKIRQGLLMKGIEKSDAEEALQSIAEEEYRETLQNELKKKAASLHEKDEYKRKAALFRFAASKGFESGLIYEIIGEG